MDQNEEKRKEMEKELDKDVEANASSPTITAPEKHEEAEIDNEIISWKGPDDPEKPVNWPTWLRWTLMSLVTAVTFCAGISSSIFAPGVPQLMREFHSTNEILATWVVSVYVLGLGFGPTFFGPLSEMYGRLPVQHVGNVGFLLFTIACGLATNLNMLIGFRLVQGVFAAVPLTNAGGIIADTVKQEERGFALSMFTLGLLSGPVVGPVIGGFLTGAKGWRWSFWVSAILVSPALTMQ